MKGSIPFRCPNRGRPNPDREVNVDPYNVFFRAVMDALANIREGTTDLVLKHLLRDVNHPYDGAQYVKVSGIYFYATMKRTRMSFMNWNFPLRKDRYSERYTINPHCGVQAARLIIEALPGRLKERAEENKQHKQWEAEREAKEKREAEAKYVSQTLPDCLSIHPADSGKFALHFTHTDKLTVMAAADHLQDSGFIEEQPRADMKDFAMKRVASALAIMPDDSDRLYAIKAAINFMSEEDKRSILNYLIGIQ